MLAAFVATAENKNPIDNLSVGDLPPPPLRPGWALVRTAYASLNHHDLWTLQGVSSRPIAPPQILGCDAVGTVVEYGDGAVRDDIAVGTTVVVHAVISCGNCRGCRNNDETACRNIALLSEGGYGGTLAEYVAVPARNLIALPNGLDPKDAACLPTAYLTAYRMVFTKANLHPGMTVLVQGATGGVATAAILLARAAGATVIATSRTEEKRAFAKTIGAHHAVAIEREGLKEVISLTDGGVDVVIETVGDPTWDFSLRALRPGGMVVVSGATGGTNPPAQLNRIFWRQIAVVGSTMGTRAELERLVQFVAVSQVRPVIDREFPLADATAALQRLADGEQRGKIVVR